MTTKKPIEYSWIEKLIMDEIVKWDDLPKTDIEFNSYRPRATFTIYTKVNHVSKSGMQRIISAYIVIDGHIQEIRYLPNFSDLKWNDLHSGWKMNGCGMDMGFALVYNLARHYGRIALGDNANNQDYGYAINQSWL
jgi:hypothetical protein